MFNVLMSGSVSFLITLLAIPVIIRVSEEKKLFDVPDARKLHKKPIASLGGVGIFSGFFLVSLLFISSRSNPEFQYFFAAAIIIFLIGVKDDILILTATKKFLGQVAAAAIIIHLGGLRLDSMHGIFGFYHVPDLIGLALSYITIILIINAFNLIDGVDGLAGSLGMLTMAVFGTYFYMNDMAAYALLAFSMAGSLAAFLVFNYNPAKIFMGDSGSLLLGLVNSILVIKFINVADTGAVAFPVTSVVAVGIAILMVPLMDTLRVFSMRIFRGRSPFSPDRNHIHHLMLDSGLNHRQVTLCCLLLNTFFIAVAYFSKSLGPNYVLFSITTISFIVLGTLLYLKKARAIAIAKQAPAEAEPHHYRTHAHTHHAPVTKVVSINAEEAAVLDS